MSEWEFFVIFIIYIPLMGYIVGKNIIERINRLEKTLIDELFLLGRNLKEKGG
jgi:hypothetical protein